MIREISEVCPSVLQSMSAHSCWSLIFTQSYTEYSVNCIFVLLTTSKLRNLHGVAFYV